MCCDIFGTKPTPVCSGKPITVLGVFVYHCLLTPSTLLGGSGGGTPHSGKPFGRGIRTGSHSSSAAAFRRYGCLRSAVNTERSTYEVFLPNVKLFPVAVQLELLLFRHLRLVQLWSPDNTCASHSLLSGRAGRSASA